MSHATVCHDEHLGRDVLVKELQSGIDQRRLSDEVAALSSIRSKHVVQIYDVIRNGSGVIVGLVEEFIPGDDLAKSIPVTNLSEFLKIAYAIACGLSDIHSAGVVHRDIKPNNLKFDAEDCLKIFDFGLARESELNAATEGGIGTPGYMAPELCVEENVRVGFDFSVDVYAFGATMLKVARSSLPAPLRQFPPSLPCAEADFGALPLSLPSEISQLLNLCLAEAPQRRPAMAAIRDGLAAQLLKDRHRATFVALGEVHILHAGRKSVTITMGNNGVARLSYDGLRFNISPVSGDVFVNNVECLETQAIPKSCVVTFGPRALGGRRSHVPIDISHPEVVL